MTLNVLYIGNFEPPHSTENDLLQTMRDMGLVVGTLQEQDVESWQDLPRVFNIGPRPDLVMWTRTASLSQQVPIQARWRLVAEARYFGIPTVGVHLDRWWGLERQSSLFEGDPFFFVDHLFTADGHHDEYWKALGVNHHWSPPAIAPHNCVIGNYRPEFASDVAFVGSWQSYGHTEWTHRGELVQFLRKHYRTQTNFWPQPGRHAIRGQDLADLYASVKVVVGDSCLVPGADGKVMTRYCSDRVFETIGRSAYLLHPHVHGVTHSLVHAGQHLGTWMLGDWEDLKGCIDAALVEPDVNMQIAAEGFTHVRDHHTYRNRLEKIFDTVIGDMWQVEPFIRQDADGNWVPS